MQAASVALGFFAIIHEVEDGGVISAGYDYDSNLGIILHRLGGLGIIPLAAIALLVVSFFTRAPGPRAGRALCSGWWCCRSRWCSARSSRPRSGRCTG
jgi:hypothetical protein